MATLLIHNGYCVNCKHSRGEDPNLTCESHNNFVHNVDETRTLVTGVEQPAVVVRRGSSCYALRADRDKETLKTVCGPEGKWFEAKEK